MKIVRSIFIILFATLLTFTLGSTLAGQKKYFVSGEQGLVEISKNSFEKAISEESGYHVFSKWKSNYNIGLLSASAVGFVLSLYIFPFKREKE